jgi:hypothetical protein
VINGIRYSAKVILQASKEVQSNFLVVAAEKRLRGSVGKGSGS